MSWKWSSITTTTKKIVTEPFSFFSQLVTPGSGKSSKRFLYILLGVDIIFTYWYVLYISGIKSRDIKNTELIKHIVDAHVMLVLGLSGVVAAVSIMGMIKGNKLPLPPGTTEETKTDISGNGISEDVVEKNENDKKERE